MLEEFSKVAQERDSDGPRRWFSDEEMDLIVWCAEDGALNGFELCYDKSGRERAFDWRRERGLRHFVVDDGESSPLRNDSPILLAGGGCGDRGQVAADFRARAARLERGLVDSVCAVFLDA
ncbi:MAG: hypothetical protein COV48_05610 [Elusimicrobia bacterium CG11_big_fil_rev_8_21_14_0_20_64_6]|nr:MAG: hypothetical protein COV48_05610 [Elusimicrobia bacterium CG11_big_fil_rev_8_21_14_0_20_64_6]